MSAWPRSADDDFVGAHEAEHVACLLVEKVDIEEFVRKSAREVFHPRDFCVEHLELGVKRMLFAKDLGPAENTEVALHGGKDEVRGKPGGKGEVDQDPECGATASAGHRRVFTAASFAPLPGA